MVNDFSRTLALLRKERKLSQRTAATQLGISQALLSHYENGAREPGLAFIVRACDYYKVSADYLLGRTMDKDGSLIDAENLFDVTEHKDNSLGGNIIAQLNKKLVVNAVSLIYGMLASINNRDLIVYVSNYFSCAVYKVFREIYATNPEYLSEYFSVNDSVFSCGVLDASMTRAVCDLEIELTNMRQNKEQIEKLSHISPDDIKKNYPALYQSLLQIVHNTNSRINKMLSVKSTDK